tara:strand:+ start:444 stop:701 length:258 start_codon:yes stop_codon:yes gene_type:complete
MPKNLLSDTELLEMFKKKSTKREVDTTNAQGYNGYKGTVYKLGNLEFFDTYSYFRFTNPSANIKYLNGTIKLTKKQFIDKLTKIL